MSEPKAKATRFEEISPGVYHWHVHDERIGSDSDAYAVVSGGETILIDPLPLEDAALKKLGNVKAIVITGPSHQRSAWRYRNECHATVHAPIGSKGLEETPDQFYQDGDLLPGGLKALAAPGPSESHFALWLAGKPGVLFWADLLLHRNRGNIEFLPDKYQESPASTRATAAKLLAYDFEVACFAHGRPIVERAKEAIQSALR